eukprot:1824144-Amphidinium_carterae.1
MTRAHRSFASFDNKLSGNVNGTIHVDVFTALTAINIARVGHSVHESHRRIASFLFNTQRFISCQDDCSLHLQWSTHLPHLVPHPCKVAKQNMRKQVNWSSSGCMPAPCASCTTRTSYVARSTSLE